MKRRQNALPILFASLLALAGCDQVAQRLGLEDPGSKEAKADGEGRAVGSACRQSGRAIEDCYSIYNWLPKASIFAGWRDMNDYMQANRLDIVEPKLPPPAGPGAAKRKKPVEAVEEKKADEAPARPSASEGKAEAKPETASDAKASARNPAKPAEKSPDKSTSKAAGKP